MVACGNIVTILRAVTRDIASSLQSHFGPEHAADVWLYAAAARKGAEGFDHTWFRRCTHRMKRPRSVAKVLSSQRSRPSIQFRSNLTRQETFHSPTLRIARQTSDTPHSNLLSNARCRSRGTSRMFSLRISFQLESPSRSREIPHHQITCISRSCGSTSAAT